MSKKELAKQEGGALAAPSPYAREYHMEGKDSSDVLMPRAILHQGDISEKYYGHHEKGTLLNSVSNEPIQSRRFVPIGLAWKEWFRFGESFGDPLQYRTRNKADVPPEDLVWQGDEPPKAELVYNFVCIFEGTDSPVCLSLKAASKFQRGAAQALNQMEEIRAARKAGPGLYELDIVDRENNKGKWKDMKIRPVGNPPDDMARMSFEFWTAFSGKTITVADDEKTGADAYDPDRDG